MFSLNLSWGLVLALVYNPHRIFVPFLRVEDLIYRDMGITAAGGLVSGYLAFAISVLLVAAPVFLVARFRRRRGAVEVGFTWLSGLLTISIPALAWFRIELRHSWYPAEVGVFLLLAAHYLWRKWPLPTFATGLMAALHYGFWFLRFRESSASPLQFLLPVVGFFACIAWGLYVRAVRNAV